VPDWPDIDQPAFAEDATASGSEQTVDLDFQLPTLTGRHVFLRPVRSEEHAWLRMADLSVQLGVRWRFRGATPSMAQWSQLSEAALAQLLVVRSSDRAALGIATVYAHNFQDQHAFLALASFSPGGRSPLVLMGGAMFIDYVFSCWAFRKLYLEMPEYNLAQFARGINRLFVQEGQLRGHHYYRGRWWDKLIFALYRERWEERSPRVLAAAMPRPSKVATVAVTDDGDVGGA
jgi:hypothetical protein